MIIPAIAFAAGYALGSIPFAFIITKLFGHGDIRQVGSGNVGATNVLRTGNKLAAALTLVGDVGKGIVAVLIAKNWGDSAAMAAALGAFSGHIFPVWLNFKGGKGVATCAGILLALTPMVALCAACTWLATVAVTRISSLSALVTAALAPFYMLLFGTTTYAIGTSMLAALIFVTHRDNISRLASGQEPKIGQKKQ